MSDGMARKLDVDRRRDVKKRALDRARRGEWMEAKSGLLADCNEHSYGKDDRWLAMRIMGHDENYVLFCFFVQRVLGIEVDRRVLYGLGERK